MREMTCEACNGTVPASQSFSLVDKTFCEPCLKSLLSDQPTQVSEDSIQRNVDFTVCVHCQADNGLEDWPQIAGLPACTK
jgi:hypothetical protein